MSTPKKHYTYINDYKVNVIVPAKSRDTHLVELSFVTISFGVNKLWVGFFSAPACLQANNTRATQIAVTMFTHTAQFHQKYQSSISFHCLDLYVFLPCLAQIIFGLE